MFLTTYVVQWATCLLFAAIVYRLGKTYRRSYFIFVYLSWIALSFMYLGTGSALYGIEEGMAPESLYRLASTTVSLVAGYCQVALLLAGVYELLTGKRFRTAVLWVGLAFLTVIGIVSPWLSLHDPAAWPTRLFIRFGVRSLAIGLAFAVSGCVLFIKRRPKSLGATLGATGFFLYGVQNLHHFGTSLSLLLTGHRVAYAPLLGFVDSFLLAMIGVGLIVWLLEVERHRVVKVTQEIERLSNFDSLTGLPNRTRFVNSCRFELSQLDEDEPAALLVIDVDSFRAVNDSFGRASGDEVLRILSERLTNWTHRPSLVARIGSDEFGMLIDDPERLGGIEVALEGLLAVIRRPVSVLGQELFVTATVGVASRPVDGRSITKLLAKAEAALHGAQRHGRDSVEHYRASMRSMTSDRLRFETKLKQALDENQFFVVYQPIVSLTNERLEGFEALVRWNHPQRGPIQPAEFLGVAADIGLLNRLEWWVVETGCRQLRSWCDLGFNRLRMSVNLTPQRFQQPGMIDTLVEIVDRVRLSPTQIQLEITEGTAFHHTEATAKTLQELRSHGFKIAIDDFGTGFASLGNLRQLPIDALKMDRSFVRTLGTTQSDDPFVGGIIGLAHALAMPVVAEGVERQDQDEVLRRAGCDSGQGYLYGRPQPAEAWATLLEDRAEYRADGDSA